MARQIKAKVGEYEKDGKTKGEYVDIGVLMSNENGEYIMLSPMVDLAGVVMKQRLLAQEKGKQPGNLVMCSIFDNSSQGANQNAGQSQPASAPQQNNASQSDDGFDDIPF